MQNIMDFLFESTKDKNTKIKFTVKDLQKAKSNKSFAFDRSNITINSDWYVKIAPDEWWYVPLKRVIDAKPIILSSQELYDTAKKATIKYIKANLI